MASPRLQFLPGEPAARSGAERTGDLIRIITWAAIAICCGVAVAVAWGVL